MKPSNKTSTFSRQLISFRFGPGLFPLLSYFLYYFYFIWNNLNQQLIKRKVTGITGTLIFFSDPIVAIMNTYMHLCLQHTLICSNNKKKRKEKWIWLAWILLCFTRLIRQGQCVKFSSKIYGSPPPSTPSPSLHPICMHWQTHTHTDKIKN